MGERDRLQGASAGGRACCAGPGCGVVARGAAALAAASRLPS
jgi:hypothetical protein